MSGMGLHTGRLQQSLAAIDGLLVDGSTAHSAAFQEWRDGTLRALRAMRGEDSPSVKAFGSLGFWNLRVMVGRATTWNDRDQARYETDLGRTKGLLSEILEEEAGIAPPAAGLGGGLWGLMHPEITALSKARFEAGHFADAVEAALKEVNLAVKAKVAARGAPGADGAALMTQAFSLKNPLVTLDDLSTESGRNVQQGYLQIFAGAMTGIRNPKAHGNLTISPERAIHLLFLASLLRFKVDEAL
ncbi:MAG: TIGR02391 family protein [Gemmatimonadales bacterium]